jgi:hypothetical protein
MLYSKTTQPSQVAPNTLAILRELMPFLALTIGQITNTHLTSPNRRSSITSLRLTEKCLRHGLLAFQIQRVEIKPTLLLPLCVNRTPTLPMNLKKLVQIAIRSQRIN